MLKKLLAPSGFKLALLLTLVMLVTFFVNALSPTGSFLSLMDKKWVDFIMKERPVQPHTSEVALATIDTKSVDRYGRWPWSRERMAELITTLNEHYEVSTIGLDITFSEAQESSGLALAERYENLVASLNLSGQRAQNLLEQLREERQAMDADAQLAEAMEAGGNVIAGFFFFTDEASIAHQSEEALEESAERISGSEISLMRGSLTRGVVPIGSAVESNIEAISDAAYLSGYFNMYPDPEDGTVRRVHLLTQYGENIYPNLDLQVLKHYYRADNIVVDADRDAGVLQIQIGSKTLLPNFDGSLLLNYKGPAGTFPHYSIYDIIEQNIPKETLQDRIILVGATEVGIYDLRTTPVGVAYPGVEVHATLLDNILTDDYFRLGLENDILSAALILAFGLVLAFALPNLASIYGTVLTVVLLVAYTFAHRWMVMELLTWTSFVYVVLTMVVIWGAVTLFRFLVTDKDKRFIRGAFQQYLSPDVISQLMDNPDLLKLGGERRVMTAFFSDVAGFSTISEKLTPEELVALLNEYLTEMTNIINESGGTVDKFEGDAIIAFWGAPVPYEDHALRAVRVSLRMQQRLAEMREAWKEQGRPELKMRIGLNTGPMVVGNMGSEKRFDYTMMGNAVNLAARLEGANKNYGTYTCCSEYTYEDVKDYIEARELDLIRVVGINQPVRLYELLGEKGEVSEDVLKGVAYFEKGLELYRRQEWVEAAKHFNAVNKFIPDDPPSAIFIERCREFKANPPVAPGEEWDGVYTAEGK